MPQDRRAAFLEMFAVAQRSTRPDKDLFQHLLSLRQGQGSQIVAIKMHQVEGIEQESVAAPFAPELEIGLTQNGHKPA